MKHFNVINVIQVFIFKKGNAFHAIHYVMIVMILHYIAKYVNMVVKVIFALIVNLKTNHYQYLDVSQNVEME